MAGTLRSATERRPSLMVIRPLPTAPICTACSPAKASNSPRLASSTSTTKREPVSENSLPCAGVPPLPQRSLATPSLPPSHISAKVTTSPPSEQSWQLLMSPLDIAPSNISERADSAALSMTGTFPPFPPYRR